MILSTPCVTVAYMGGYFHGYDLIMFGMGMAQIKQSVITCSPKAQTKNRDIKGQEQIIEYIFGDFDPYRNSFFCVWDKIFRGSIIKEYDIRFQTDVTLGEDQILFWIIWPTPTACITKIRHLR